MEWLGRRHGWHGVAKANDDAGGLRQHTAVLRGFAAAGAGLGSAGEALHKVVHSASVQRSRHAHAGCVDFCGRDCVTHMLSGLGVTPRRRC